MGSSQYLAPHGTQISGMPASVASSWLTGSIDDRAYSDILDSLTEVYDDLQDLMRDYDGLLSSENKRANVQRKTNHQVSFSPINVSFGPSQELRSEIHFGHTFGSAAKDKRVVAPQCDHGHDNTTSTKSNDGLNLDMLTVTAKSKADELHDDMARSRTAQTIIEYLRYAENAPQSTPFIASSLSAERGSLNSTESISTSINTNKILPPLLAVKGALHKETSLKDHLEDMNITELMSWLSPPSESSSASPTAIDYRDLIQDHGSATFSNDDTVIENVIEYTPPAAPLLAPLTTPLISPVHEPRFYPSLHSPTSTTGNQPDQQIPLHVHEPVNLLPSRASTVSEKIKRWRDAAACQYSAMSIRTLLTTNGSFFYHDDGLPMEHPRDVWGAPGGDARMAEVERKRCLKDRIRRLAGRRASVASTAEWELREVKIGLARESVRKGEDGLSRTATEESVSKMLSETSVADIERPLPLYVPKKAEQVLGSRSKFSPWSSTTSLQPRPLSATKKASKKIAKGAARGLELAVGKPEENFNIPAEWERGLDY